MPKQNLSFSHHWLLNAVYALRKDAIKKPFQIPSRESETTTQDNQAAHCEYWLEHNTALQDIRNAQHQVEKFAKSIILVFAVLFFISGIALVNSVLSGSQDVLNVPALLVTTIGVNTILCVVWLVSYFMSASRGRGLGGWLMAKIPFLVSKFGKKSQLLAGVGSQYLSTLTELKLAKLTFAVITHTLWSAYLVGILLAIFFHMLFGEYWFVWETTLLNQQQLQTLQHIVGAGMFWFQHTDLTALEVGGNRMEHQFAAVWLLSAIMFYGLLPRVIALSLVFVVRKMKLSAKFLWSSDKPSYVLFNQYHLQNSRVTDLDTELATQHKVSQFSKVGEGSVCFALEDKVSSLAPDDMQDLGVISSRSQLQQVADEHNAPWADVLVFIPSQLSPDRGNLAILEEVCGHAKSVEFQLVPQQEHYAEVWRSCIENRESLAGLKEQTHGI
ncbi:MULTISPECIES: DUF2868 domain-containing protein [Gammaproteobacteria]|uniref:DUF2868 domain-containing protein n=1 Tax=Gammaproteobacteria TaxID=1236 RepID=UPI000DD0E60E|nr:MULTISPECIES: DUF2868 domain-containing protein [Gammaproteobacteria]RTE87187.1 DUF2868 domain-containing protein [Aliidiomarina sp. B3213]TCZ93025.1 DUF2868 domain-containing protein [Lysobacter sp. N42]